jgi:hypothetical protein
VYWEEASGHQPVINRWVNKCRVLHCIAVRQGINKGIFWLEQRATGRVHLSTAEGHSLTNGQASTCGLERMQHCQHLPATVERPGRLRAGHAREQVLRVAKANLVASSEMLVLKCTRLRSGSSCCRQGGNATHVNRHPTCRLLGYPCWWASIPSRDTNPACPPESAGQAGMRWLGRPCWLPSFVPDSTD